MATDIVRITANQVMHSNEESIMACFLLASHFQLFFVVVVVVSRVPEETIRIKFG